MEYKFYKVTSGEFIKLIADLLKSNALAKTALIDFKNEIGANDVFQYNAGGVAYFTFDVTPDLTLWKKANDGFMPRRGNKDGKTLSEKLRNLPRHTNLQSCLSIFKLDNMMVLGESTPHGTRMHGASFYGKHESKTYFIKVPQEKENSYQPTSDDLVECKEWEMLKFMDK